MTYQEILATYNIQTFRSLPMTYQEILEGITRHRANPIDATEAPPDLVRKVEEIEWALQALAEKLRDDDAMRQQIAQRLAEEAKRMEKANDRST